MRIEPNIDYSINALGRTWTRAWAWGWPWMSESLCPACLFWEWSSEGNGHEMVSYWGFLDESASGCRRAKGEDVNAYGMSLASERRKRWRRYTNFSLPSTGRELSLGALMMTICLMKPLLGTGSVCLTSRRSAGRMVKGCPWAARGKGMGLGGESWHGVCEYVRTVNVG